MYFGKIICPICKNLNLNSKCYEIAERSTELPALFYYDEQGNKQVDNPNENFIMFNCSNSHQFIFKYKTGFEDYLINSNEIQEILEKYFETTLMYKQD